MKDIVYQIIDDEVFVNLESLIIVLLEQPSTKKTGLDTVLNGLQLRILQFHAKKKKKQRGF